MRNKIIKLAGLVSVVALLAMPQIASAVGVASGTSVTNQATLNFTVGGAGQPAVLSDGPGGPGTPTTFVVDTAINVNVATTNVAAVAVNTPNSTGNVLTFKVTNLGNATQDFRLTAAAIATGGAAKFGGTDAFDMTTATAFIDGNANGIYDAGVDTGTFVDELPADAYATVFIVSTAPATLTDGYTAAYTLTATGATGGTAAVLGADAVATAGANGLNGVDIAFADAAGFGGVDAAQDGKHTDASDFSVSAPIISLGKTVVISDPYGGANAIPGATATYTLTISNTGTASAVLSSIGDPIDASLTVVANPGAGSWALSNGVSSDSGTLTADANAADGLDFGTTTPGSVTFTIPTFLTTANTINTSARATPGELKAGETLTLTFDATIN